MKKAFLIILESPDWEEISKIVILLRFKISLQRNLKLTYHYVGGF